MKIFISVSDESTPEEQHLLKTLGNPVDFRATCLDGSLGKYAKLKYLTKAWNKANKIFLDGALKLPVLTIMRNSGPKFRMRGYWQSSTRIIAISPRLFNAGEESKVLTTLVHEMCHQAEAEIDGSMDSSNGFHSARWMAWMNQCGLTGSRYSKYDNQTFLDDDEKDEQVERKKLAEEYHEVKDTKPFADVTDWTPAQFYDPKQKTWLKGLIVCRGDRQGTRWCFLTDPHGTTFNYVQTSGLRKIDEYEAREILTDQSFIMKGNKIARMMQSKGIPAYYYDEWKDNSK